MQTRHSRKAPRMHAQLNAADKTATTMNNKRYTLLSTTEARTAVIASAHKFRKCPLCLTFFRKCYCSASIAEVLARAQYHGLLRAIVEFSLAQRFCQKETTDCTHAKVPIRTSLIITSLSSALSLHEAAARKRCSAFSRLVIFVTAQLYEWIF